MIGLNSNPDPINTRIFRVFLFHMSFAKEEIKQVNYKGKVNIF